MGMSIFCPKTFPKSVQEKASFGNTKLNKLICHFGESRGHTPPPTPIDKIEAKREWPFFQKSHAWFEGGVGNSLTGAALAEKMINSEQMKDFPNMIKLM